MSLPDGFSTELPAPLAWQHVASTASTNTYLLADNQPPNQLFSADRQTQGRGRRGQTWADNQESVLFSLSTALTTGADFSAWPIQVAITLADSLNRLAALSATAAHPAVQIKWPNDLYTRYRDQWGKCGGILVESTLGSQRQHGKIVTGVGLNLAPLHDLNINSDYPIAPLPISLHQLNLNKKQLIALLAGRLWQAWQHFSVTPTVDPAHYQHVDFLYGKALTATDAFNQHNTTGHGAGINPYGHLLVKQANTTVALSAQQRIRLNP